MMFLSSLFVLSASVLGAVYGMDLINKCPAERDAPWSYHGENGPPYWGLTFPKCYGNQQSPILIIGFDVIKDKNLDKLTLNNYYQPISKGKIENNGHTVEIVPEDGVSRTISVNGDEYSLRQLHFHWGEAYYRGSEHILSHQYNPFTRYAMEMHLVHMTADNQIAVVGIFFQEQDDDNEELQKIVDEFPNVKYKGDESELHSSINLNNLLPANPTSFYRYEGSLTTPPCSEGVIWSVVPDPIPVGRAQMNQFRTQLYSVKKENATESCKIFNNHRPVQLQRGRKVTASQ